MINPSTRTKTVIPNNRGTTCNYKDDDVGSSSGSYEKRNRQQQREERYESLQERFNDNTNYGFLAINDDTFENFLKNDKFEEDEEDIDYDIITQLGNPLDNLRTERNEMLNFRSVHDNMSKSWSMNKNLREECSNNCLHRQTKDETRCIRKSDEDSFRSQKNGNEYGGASRHSNYDNRKNSV